MIPHECLPMGICIPCNAGDHDRCNDFISFVGCACTCNQEES